MTSCGRHSLLRSPGRFGSWVFSACFPSPLPSSIITFVATYYHFLQDEGSGPGRQKGWEGTVHCGAVGVKAYALLVQGDRPQLTSDESRPDTRFLVEHLRSTARIKDI